MDFFFSGVIVLLALFAMAMLGVGLGYFMRAGVSIGKCSAILSKPGINADAFTLHITATVHNKTSLECQVAITEVVILNKDESSNFSFSIQDAVWVQLPPGQQATLATQAVSASAKILGDSSKVALITCTVKSGQDHVTVARRVNYTLNV